MSIIGMMAICHSDGCIYVTEPHNIVFVCLFSREAWSQLYVPYVDLWEGCSKTHGCSCTTTGPSLLRRKNSSNTYSSWTRPSQAVARRLTFFLEEKWLTVKSQKGKYVATSQGWTTDSKHRKEHKGELHVYLRCENHSNSIYVTSSVFKVLHTLSYNNPVR